MGLSDLEVGLSGLEAGLNHISAGLCALETCLGRCRAVERKNLLKIRIFCIRKLCMIYSNIIDCMGT